MKGIIAEIHSSYMVVITKDGSFIKCKKLPGCDIGDEINIPSRNMNSVYRKLTAIAASFILLVMLSTGAYAYYTPYSYISVDINPSLELFVNRFDKVIGVHAFNEDADKVLERTKNLKNKQVDEALKQILNSAADEGYLKKYSKNSVMIVVSTNNKKEEIILTDKVSNASTEALSNISGNYEVILEKTKVENYKKAKEENVSPGKVILANQFKEVKPEINEEEIKHMPLQQAIKEIEKQEIKEQKDESKEQKKQGKAQKNEDKDQKQQSTAKAEQPKTATAAKPDDKTQSNANANIKNVKELIKEKNEELGKKLEEKEKDEKKKDTETLNQSQQGQGNSKDKKENDKKNEEKQQTQNKDNKNKN